MTVALSDPKGPLAAAKPWYFREHGATEPTIAQLTAAGLDRAAKADSDHEAAELHFVLPTLKSGETRKLHVSTNVPMAATPAAAWRWKDTAGKYTDLAYGDRPVLRYMYEALDDSSKERHAATFKVYHHVYDPAGKLLLTKGPGGLFPHHRGVFYGFNKITYGKHQADVWHCAHGESQAHTAFLAAEAGAVVGRHRVAIDWKGQDGKPFAKEQREMAAMTIGKGTLIEFASHLESTVGKVHLDGDPQHAGFQFRATQAVPDKTAKETVYLRPDGRDKPGATRNWDGKTNTTHVNLPWDALSFVVDGQRYTVVYLDHPKNPKPARFSERDYGRFGSYFVYDLDNGKPLDLRYRLWVQAGEMTGEECAALSNQFVSPPEATGTAVKD
jgi:hypothetical protein